MAKFEYLRETLYYFYKNNGHLSRKEVFDKFRDVNRWLVLLAQNKTLVHNSSQKSNSKCNKRHSNHKTGRSQKNTKKIVVGVRDTKKML